MDFRRRFEGILYAKQNAGNIIMGINTYLATSKSGYFPFPDALNVVVSHQKIENKWDDKNGFSNRLI